jgi:uncharacterized membrane protein YeiH
MDPLQTIIGIKLTNALAGIAGGTVRALLMRGPLSHSIGAVVIGCFTSSYTGPTAYAVALKYLPIIPVEPSTEHTISFLLGVTAMFVCEAAINKVRKWSANPILPTAT